VQKFNHNLSESISDSIFSIFAEEFGFVFSVILILIYTALGLKIFINLTKIQNYYEQMVVAGLATNILFPAFYNMWTVVGIAPLSGIPLTFISKGGTSIFFSLLSVGIILLFFQKK
jgi:cell division protein FtsW (lipid II flippase)